MICQLLSTAALKHASEILQLRLKLRVTLLLIRFIMAAHVWATSGWVSRHCITLNTIRCATRILVDPTSVSSSSTCISVFMTLWWHWVFLWWMLTVAWLASCIILLMCTFAIVLRSLLTRVRSLLLASFVACCVACRWATRCCRIRLISDWGLVWIVAAICVRSIGVLIRALACTSWTWRTLLLLGGLNWSWTRLHTTATRFDRLLLLLLNLLFFFGVICGSLPFLLLLLVLLALLLGLKNVVHKVIYVLIIHLFVGIVKLLTLHSLISFALTLVSIPLLLPITLFASICEVIHRTILSVASTHTLTTLCLSLVSLELYAVMICILAWYIALISRTFCTFSLGLSLLLLLL